MLPIGCITLDPRNSRKKFRGIPDLAATIKEHGLLQNLVVSQLDDHQYVIVCGERRYRALCSLYDEEHEVPCQVVDPSDTDRQVMNLLENTARHDVPSWDLGAAYANLIDQGLLQKDIGKKVGKSQQHVSQHISIATNIHPEVLAKIVKLGSQAPPAADLLRISKLRDPIDNPDKGKQLEMLSKMFLRARPKNSTSTQTLRKKFSSLKVMSVTPEAEPYVEAVIEYLQKGKRFKYEIN